MNKDKKITRSFTSVNRKKLLLAGAAMALVLTGAGVIHAGFRYAATNWEVTISGTSTGSFGGSLAAARASNDNLQYIGCEVNWYGPTPTNTVTVTPLNSGFCYARDRSGNSRGCYVTIQSGTASALLGNVNQDSYVSASYFTKPDVAYCSALTVYNYSYGAVKGN